MHKVVAMAELYPVLEDKLRAGGCITLTTTGFSMAPMLVHQRDTIVLGPVLGPLRINDVVLYRRESGQFVLHRIIGREENGDYILCGDGQFLRERHVHPQQVAGRLQAFTRKGRLISCTSTWYRLYVCVLPALRCLRHGFFTGQRYLGSIKRLTHRSTKGSG